MPADRKVEVRPLLELVGDRGRRGKELVPAIQGLFGCGSTQAYEALQDCVAGQLLTETALSERGKPKLYTLSVHGKQLLADPGHFDSRLTAAFKKGKRARRKTVAPSNAAKGDSDSVVEEVRSEPAPTARAPRPRRVGDPRHKRIRSYRKNNDINGFYRLWFGGRTTRYIQLLLPVREAYTGPLWKSLHVGFDEEGLQRFVTVIADEDASKDRLRALLPDWGLSDQFALPAVELVKTKTGFKVGEHLDEAGALSPSLGVICQSTSNFLEPLKRMKPNGRIVQIKGSGSSKPQKNNPTNYRRYAFTDAGAALPLTVTFDFEQFLKDLGDPRHEQEVLALPNGWFNWWPTQRLMYWQAQAASTTGT